MKTVIATVSILFASMVYGQQMNLNSQYLFNEMLVNPGATGGKDYIPVQLNFRKQWARFDGAPTTQFLSAHGSVGKNMGIGGVLYNDVSGPSRRTGMIFNTSYSLKLDQAGDHKLGFGLGLSITQNLLDLSVLNTYLPDDPALQLNYNHVMTPDGNTGVYYTFKDKAYVGISAYNLVQSNRALYRFPEVIFNPIARNYYLLGGYNFDIKKDYGINLSTLFQAIETGTFQFDVSAIFEYKDFIWAGGSYRFNDAVVAMIGGQVGPFKFGYAYDFTLSEIATYSNGSHEVFLELQLNKKASTSPNSNSSLPWLKRNRVYSPK